MRQVPLARQLQHAQAVPLGVRTHPLELFVTPLHPSLRAELAVVVLRELMSRPHVVVEYTAVVNHAGDQAHIVCNGGVEYQLARPWLHRAEDHHRPVDLRAIALQTVDQVQREPVRWAGRHPQQPRETRVANRLHTLPNGWARVTKMVGVVQQQQVERLAPYTLQATLGALANVVAVSAL